MSLNDVVTFCVAIANLIIRLWEMRKGRRFLTEEHIADFQRSRGNPDYVDYRYANGPIR